MALVKVQLSPGIDKQDTEYGAEGRWFDGDNVRFRYGLPEKIGGWAKVTSDALLGAARGMRAWFSLDGDPYTITGTNKKLYVYANNAWSDITPVRDASGSITDITTTNAKADVTITDASHGAVEGDFVTLSSVSGAANGITAAELTGEFEIQSITSTSQYVITSKGTATSTGAGSVTATGSYEINTKPAASIQGYGWGAGTWGLSTWGTTRSGLAAPNSVQLDAGKWSIDNWGEDALCQFFNGSLYYWDTSVGTGTVAAIVSNAPTTSRFAMVSGTDRHVILFGTETTIASAATQDDMFIRWSDQDDYTAWTPTATNTAGSQRLTDGSRLIAAARSRGAVLILSLIHI